jgi:putative FmdB family regulatory protein
MASLTVLAVLACWLTGREALLLQRRLIAGFDSLTGYQIFMPLYEYRCEKCGEKVETWKGINEPDLTEHECGGKLDRVLSPPSIHFKGTGWTEKSYK